jgi:glycosyltransferase involved in cell wall biosynthesis
MSIVIFGDSFSYPEGDAPTNRVNTYAKGFYENGIKAHVICFANEYNSPGDGILNGINYYNPFGQKERSNYFLIRNWKKVLKVYKTLVLLRRINREDKISMITVYTMKLSIHLYGWLLSRLTNSKLMKECGEHPLRLYQDSLLKRAQGIMKLHIEARFSDGIFCISRFLVEFYKEHGIPQRKLFLVPSTVDPTRFAQEGDSPLSFRYVGYFGGLTFKRDNIDVLIKAYSLISDKYPKVHLVLGGFCSDGERKKIEQLIIDLNIGSKVLLLKYLSRQEILRYITHSEILVMVRGNDMESQASFPSKLTEYLATSRPVITVNVGEISDYLIDGVNAFLIEPGNCEMLAEKIEFVLNNYESALEVASKGQLLAATDFNYHYQAKRIIQYIHDL